MRDSIALILFNILFGSVGLFRLRRWDTLTRRYVPTYAREKVSDRSKPYKKMVRTELVVLAVSLVGSAAFAIIETTECYSWGYSIAGIFGMSYFFYPPILVWQLFVAERREKQWLIITNRKRKLTRKERREAEQKLKQISLFKRLDRLREEQ